MPLAIALDQENGGVNSLFDESCIRQFPSAMSVTAAGSTKMAYEVAKAIAEELCSVGVNWIMGPRLDVLTNVKNQPLGVRSSATTRKRYPNMEQHRSEASKTLEQPPGEAFPILRKS